MKAFRIQSTVWALGITMLLGATASADNLNFNVGFTGIQVTYAPGRRLAAGKIRYVDMEVGSNESQSTAKTYMIFFQLGVRDESNGTIACNNGIEFLTKVRPAIRPLRFQLLYPYVTQPGPGAPPLATKKYTLVGKIQVRDGNTLVETDEYKFTVDFPGGGTQPTCPKLMSQGQ